MAPDAYYALRLLESTGFVIICIIFIIKKYNKKNLE